MVNYSQTTPESNDSEEAAALDMMPSGMIVQNRVDAVSGPTPAAVTLKLSYGSQQLDLPVPSDSTFGQVKDIIAQVIGLEPKVQKLLFRGKEKEDGEYLSMAGIKDNSKVILMEETTSIEINSEEAEEKSETSREGEVNSESTRGGEAFENITEEVEAKKESSRGFGAVAVVREEVDKLSEQVDALHVVVNGGTKVDEKDIVYLTEMLMRQLLKLDGIDAEGEGKVKRKEEVRRVQRLVDNMDVLKGRNSNLFLSNSNPPHNTGAMLVETQPETFDSGVGSLSPPPPPGSPPPSSSNVVTNSWEEFK